MVLVLQLRGRSFADLRAFVLIPRLARHRHGRRVASWRRARDGIVARPFPGHHEWHPARLMEHRISALQRSVRATL
jgi:hypothetical protein